MSRVAGLLVAFVVLLLLTAQVSTAQSFTVAYLDGHAQLRSGDSWIELAIGDALSIDSSVRLAAGGFLQIRGVGVLIALTRPGAYKVRDVVAAARTMSSTGVGAALARSLRLLVSGRPGQAATVLGTRGADESNSDVQGWTEGSAEVFLAAAKEYIKAEKYDKAIELLDQALESADEGEAPQIHYFLAFASSLKGDVPEAWKQIEGLQPAASAPWVPDFILLKARLLEDTNAFTEAVSLLSSNGQLLAEDALRAPLYYFLLGIAYRGTGEMEKSKLALSRVMSISEQSALGKAASDLLRGP